MQFSEEMRNFKRYNSQWKEEILKNTILNRKKDS